MNSLTITISNYRNIPIQSPVELELKDGVTFILGLNNVGKTNLLKFFFELRGFLSFDEEKGIRTNGNHGSKYFDHFANRNNLNHPIKFKLSREDVFIEYSIKSKDKAHSANLEVSYITSYGENLDRIKIEKIKNILSDFSNIMYIGSSRTVISQTNSRYFDIQIGTAFFESWSQWATGNDFTQIKLIKELIIELKELFEFQSFNIEVSSDKKNLLITTDDGLFTLDELGTGISHFIVVLANALIKKPSFILIDEPETGLHPKLQQRFIRALASKSKYGLAATSHSIGLARSSADFILSLIKEENGYVKLKPFGHSNYSSSISGIINELNYSQYAELGGSKILLVEGRTDIKSFREILRKYSIEHEFIIISFGGRQFMTTVKSKIIDELSELNRFNTEVFVIFDSEKTSENAQLKPEFEIFHQVCEELGFNVFATDYHSTENYISQSAINNILNSGIQKLDKFEKFENQWKKEQNWLMFRDMELVDFEETELNNFIKNKMK